MKKVIRQSVFETNSSSTHSFTIKKVCKKKEKCSFVLKSKLAKMVWFMGLCDNAGRNFEAQAPTMTIEEIKDLLATRIQYVYDNSESMRECIKQDEMEGYKKLDLSEMERVLWCWDEEFLEYKEENDIESYLYNSDDRDFVEGAKTILLKKFADSQNVTVDQAVKMIFDEAGRNYSMEKFLEGATTNEEIAKRLSEVNSYFKYQYEQAEDKQAIIDQYTGKNCSDCNGCSCEHYFEEGVLNDCYCGFESYYDMNSKLHEAIKKYKIAGETDQEKVANLILSDEIIILGQEDYAGISPIYSDDEY